MAEEGKKKIPWKRYLTEIGIIALVILLIYIFLLPRPNPCKGKNRDVARRDDLIQISTAINEYKDKYGVLPELDNAINGMTVSSLPKDIMGGHWIPSDPNPNSEIYGLGDAKGTGDYLYLVAQDGGFILMAKTEWEGQTNWIVCKDGSGLEQGYITNDTDIDDIKLCDRVDKTDTCSTKDCTYTMQEELRRIVITEP